MTNARASLLSDSAVRTAERNSGALGEMFPQSLVDALASGEAAVFVGAGIGCASGLPTWEKLIAPLRIEGTPEDASAPDVAQFYLNAAGDSRLVAVLKDAIDSRDARPSEIHTALVSRLPLRRIYTTNFDDLIERACALASRPCERIVNASTLTTAAPHALRVYKLHGDFTAPGEIVIATEHFEDYEATHPVLAKEIAHTLTESTVLFLGYSFNDPNIRNLLSTVRRETRRFMKQHFIVQLTQRETVLRELRRRNLEPIALAPGSSPEDRTMAVLDWLSELIERVDDARGVVPRSVPRASSPLLGRGEKLRELENALARHRVVVLEGGRGIGKTELAAKLCRSYAFSCQHLVWIETIEGETDEQSLDRIVSAILAEHGYLRLARAPSEELAKKLEIARILLEESPVLVVVDNARPGLAEALAGWVLPPKPDRRLLIITPPGRVAAVGDEKRITLDALSRPDAVTLLKRLLRDASDEGLRDLAEATARNPQAMRLAAGLLNSSAGASGTRNLLKKLEGVRGDLDALFAQLLGLAWQRAAKNDGSRKILDVLPLFAKLPAV
ncbi:MAG: SIR2 family protein, partial [Myxococcales bacterium]|nr:SIR2 family protein [Myxococcales bacterium]